MRFSEFSEEATIPDDDSQPLGEAVAILTKDGPPRNSSSTPLMQHMESILVILESMETMLDDYETRLNSDGE